MQVSNDGLFNISQNLNSANRVLAEITSGTQSKSGDVASASIASHLNTQVASYSQGLANANDGISMMQVADGATTQLKDNLQRLNELSVEYGNGILNDDNRTTLEQEFSAIVGSMQDIVDSTSFNGNVIFGEELTFNIADSSVSTSIASLDFSSLDVTDQGSIEDISKTLASVSSEIGSTSNALESSSRSIFASMVNTAAAASQMSDTDIAQAITEFNQSSIQLEASTIAQVHKITQMQQSIQTLLG